MKNYSAYFRSLFLFSFILIQLASCTKESQPAILARVLNHSGIPIENIVVYSLNGENPFGVLESNGMTSYKEIGDAYGLPACRFTANGYEYQVMIRCNTPALDRLTPGRYSFIIRWISAENYEVVMEKD